MQLWRVLQCTHAVHRSWDTTHVYSFSREALLPMPVPVPELSRASPASSAPPRSGAPALSCGFTPSVAPTLCCDSIPSASTSPAFSHPVCDLLGGQPLCCNARLQAADAGAAAPSHTAGRKRTARPLTVACCWLTGWSKVTAGGLRAAAAAWDCCPAPPS